MHLFHEAQTTFSPRLSEVATHHTHGIHDDAIFIIRKACLTQQGMITLAKSQDVDIQLTHLMDPDGPDGPVLFSPSLETQGMILTHNNHSHLLDKPV